MSKHDFIPPGFVPLAQWDYRSRGKADGHSPEYKELRLAVDSGKVPGIHVGGSNRWYVREADATAFLKAQATDAPPRQEQPSDLQYESVCESMADIAAGLGHVVTLLDRLATAVEGIATQPKTPQQELLHTMNGNGFHS